MAFDPLNLKEASVQFKQSMGRVIDERLAPLFDRSITHVSQELSDVIRERFTTSGWKFTPTYYYFA